MQVATNTAKRLPLPAARLSEFGRVEKLAVLAAIGGAAALAVEEAYAQFQETGDIEVIDEVITEWEEEVDIEEIEVEEFEELEEYEEEYDETDIEADEAEMDMDIEATKAEIEADEAEWKRSLKKAPKMNTKKVPMKAMTTTDIRKNNIHHMLAYSDNKVNYYAAA